MGGLLLRLNQAIARAGVCSRRKADELIAAGKVSVNGKIIRQFNETVDLNLDKVAVNGKALTFKSYIYLAMYKPKGLVTTCADEYGRAGVLDLLPGELRHVRPVGRLDKDSEGLLILTNDGQLTKKITHPQYHLAKKYVVSVAGQASRKDLQAISSGVELSDGRTAPAKARLLQAGHGSRFELTIFEGRNRQVRRMCAQLGLRVISLVRVGIGGLQLGQMAPGQWRYLNDGEMRKLMSGAGNDS